MFAEPEICGREVRPYMLNALCEKLRGVGEAVIGNEALRKSSGWERRQTVGKEGLCQIANCRDCALFEEER